MLRRVPLLLTGLAVLLCFTLSGCSQGVELHSQRLDFQSAADADGTLLVAMERDGVSVSLYDSGSCGTLIEHVPGYGYLVEELCPPVATADPYGFQFSTPKCTVPVVGDECGGDEIPSFTVGRTIDEAEFVCVAGGRIEVSEGWWLARSVFVEAEAFPLDADGRRLDSAANEFDDVIRRACGAADAEVAGARLEILPAGYTLPITVELDAGASGIFRLNAGFEPFIFDANLPAGGPEVFVVVVEGTDGRGIGSVRIADPPGCSDPIFVLDLSGPAGSWECAG